MAARWGGALQGGAAGWRWSNGAPWAAAMADGLLYWGSCGVEAEQKAALGGDHGDFVARLRSSTNRR